MDLYICELSTCGGFTLHFEQILDQVGVMVLHSANVRSKLTAV